MHDGREHFNFDQCKDCNLVFLNPRVPEKDLGEYYTSYYLPYRVEEAWGKYAHFVEGSQKRIDKKRVATVNKFHPIKKESKILDVGCGKPTFLKAIQEKINCQLFGLDFSDEGWKYEPNRYAGINLLKGDIDDLDTTSKMDVITMWHYLEHDYRPQKNLRKLLKIAHPETRLIIEVPNFDSHTRKKFGKNWAGYHTPRHTGLYSPNNMKILLNNAGWKIEKIYAHGTLDPYTLQWMSRMEKKGIDWQKSMEGEFIGYVVNMVLAAPLYLLHKNISLGFMTAVATPAI